MNELPHVLPQFEHIVPCCGAKAKRTGKRCRQPAMRNGKCRLHGSKSTSAKTAQGRYNRDHANYQHGYYSQAEKQSRQQAKQALQMMQAMLDKLTQAA